MVKVTQLSMIKESELTNHNERMVFLAGQVLEMLCRYSVEQWDEISRLTEEMDYEFHDQILELAYLRCTITLATSHLAPDAAKS